MFTPNFEMRNANGYGSYYRGLPTSYQMMDNIVYNFGDSREDALAQAIYLITGKITNPNINAFARSSSSQKQMRRVVGSSPKANIMIGSPKRILNN